MSIGTSILREREKKKSVRKTLDITRIISSNEKEKKIKRFPQGMFIMAAIVFFCLFLVLVFCVVHASGISDVLMRPKTS